MDSIDIAEPRKRSRAFTVGMLLVGGVLLTVILCGGTCAGLAVFGWNVFEEDAKKSLQQNPVILEHIGTIEDISLSLTGMAEESNSAENVFVFDLVGDRGEGRVSATFLTRGEREVITEGILEMPDGTVHDLLEGQDKRKRRRR